MGELFHLNRGWGWSFRTHFQLCQLFHSQLSSWSPSSKSSTLGYRASHLTQPLSSQHTWGSDGHVCAISEGCRRSGNGWLLPIGHVEDLCAHEKCHPKESSQGGARVSLEELILPSYEDPRTMNTVLSGHTSDGIGWRAWQRHNGGKQQPQNRLHLVAWQNEVLAGEMAEKDICLSETSLKDSKRKLGIIEWMSGYHAYTRRGLFLFFIMVSAPRHNTL